MIGALSLGRFPLLLIQLHLKADMSRCGSALFSSPLSPTSSLWKTAFMACFCWPGAPLASSSARFAQFIEDADGVVVGGAELDRPFSQSGLQDGLAGAVPSM